MNSQPLQIDIIFHPPVSNYFIPINLYHFCLICNRDVYAPGKCFTFLKHIFCLITKYISATIHLQVQSGSFFILFSFMNAASRRWRCICFAGKPSAKPEHGEAFIKNPMRVDFAAEIKYNDIYHRKNYREV